MVTGQVKLYVVVQGVEDWYLPDSLILNASPETDSVTVRLLHGDCSNEEGRNLCCCSTPSCDRVPFVRKTTTSNSLQTRLAQIITGL